MSAPSVYTGVRLAKSNALIQPTRILVDRGSPASAAGLRSGEVLGCLSFRDYMQLFSGSFGVQTAYRPGTPIEACVRHGATTHLVHLAPRAGPVFTMHYGGTVLTLLRVLVLVVFLLCGLALVIAKPNLTTWVFYVFCLSSAPSSGAASMWTIFAGWQYLLATGLPLLATATAASWLLLFAVVVPEARIPKGWRRAAFFCALFLVFADIGFIAWAFAAGSLGLHASLPLGSDVDNVLTALTVIVVIARLATMERAERARFGWAAFAIIFGVVVNDLRSSSPNPLLQSIAIAASYLIVIMPLCLMYAILKRHVIDVRFAISCGVVYACVTTLVVGVIGLVDWLTSAYLSQVRAAMAIDAAVAVGLAFALHRAYRSIETAVDLVLFRRKHDAETHLNRLAKTLLRAKQAQTVDRAIVHAPYEQFDLTMAALFRASGSAFMPAVVQGWNACAASFDEEHDLVRFLVTERTKLHLHEVGRHVAAQFEEHGGPSALAIPLFQGDDLAAFAVYGVHKDGTKLDPDEVATLERLCEVAAQAYVAIELALLRRASPPIPPPELAELALPAEQF